jgi:hypothetical protein
MIKIIKAILHRTRKSPLKMGNPLRTCKVPIESERINPVLFHLLAAEGYPYGQTIVE